MKLVNGRRVGRLSAPELGTVLAMRKDGTVQSALIKSSDKKTLTQTYQRLKMPNLGSFYKKCNGALRKAFENSVINIFAELVRYNLSLDFKPVGITKSEKASGACVAMPYQITDGSLRPIRVNGHVTDIAVNGDLLEQISAATTIGEFAKAVVESNGGRFNYDDKITFIEVRQSFMGSMPIVSVGHAAVTLVEDSTETFGSLGINLKGFSIDGERIAVQGTPAVGCFAWVHSRKDADGNLELSKQSLVDNNQDVIAKYTSASALRAAAASYGVDYKGFAVLEPNTLGERRIMKAFGFTAAPGSSEDADNTLQMLYVTIGGKMYGAGDEGPVLDNGDKVVAQISDASQLGSTIQCKINGQAVSNPVRDGNTITLPVPATLEGDLLATVTIMDASHTLKLEF